MGRARKFHQGEGQWGGRRQWFLATSFTLWTVDGVKL